MTTDPLGTLREPLRGTPVAPLREGLRQHGGNPLRTRHWLTTDH
ncbi:hypothetical protein [Anabaena sp. CCY 9910]